VSLGRSIHSVLRDNAQLFGEVEGGE